MKPWEANIRRVVPYVPGEQPKGSGIVKLNTNENPYPPAPGVRRTLKELSIEDLRKYPDPTAGALTGCLADYYQVRPDQVFVGVGSDDVLAMAFLAFFNSGKPIIFPDISYSFYKVWAELFGIPYETAPLDEEFLIRPEDYYRENGGVIFPNPNAPTGLLMSLEQVEDVISHNQDVIVIVDEAYIDFGGRSALELLERYENLLIVQTFSKARSMAGMRIGFAIGGRELIKLLQDVKYSFNSYTMNLPSLVLGTEAVRDEKYFRDTINRIVDTRERTKRRLQGLGFSFPDSMSNFIFAAHEKASASELFEALKKEGIYVRYFRQSRLENYLRITIGTDEEMEKLFAFLESYLGNMA